MFSLFKPTITDVSTGTVQIDGRDFDLIVRSERGWIWTNTYGILKKVGQNSQLNINLIINGKYLLSDDGLYDADFVQISRGTLSLGMRFLINDSVNSNNGGANLITPTHVLPGTNYMLGMRTPYIALDIPADYKNYVGRHEILFDGDMRKIVESDTTMELKQYGKFLLTYPTFARATGRIYHIVDGTLKDVGCHNYVPVHCAGDTSITLADGTTFGCPEE